MKRKIKKNLCCNLINAIKQEENFDYGSIDKTWQYALDEMSNEVNEIWRDKMQEIYNLASVLSRELGIN